MISEITSQSYSFFSGELEPLYNWTLYHESAAQHEHTTATGKHTTATHLILLNVFSK